MASFTFTNAKRMLLAGELDWDSNTIKVALLMTSHSLGTSGQEDATVISGITTPDECNASGYTAGGVTLTASAPTSNTGSNRGEADATDISWATLGNGSRQIAGMLIYKDVGGVWANGIPIAWVEFTSTINPGGSTLTVQWASGGILQVS